MANFSAILDEVGTAFPAHADKVDTLSQSLSDLVGTKFLDSNFFFVFIDSYDDSVLLEAQFISEAVTIEIPGLSGFALVVGTGDELEVDVAVVLDDERATFYLLGAPISVQCLKTEWLTPVVKVGEKWEPEVNADGTAKKAEVVFSGLDLEADTDGRLQIASDVAVDLPPVMLGKSGVVVEMRGLRPCLSDGAQLPDGVPAGSRGFAVDSVEVYLPESIKGDFLPGEIAGEGLFVGSGGFTGKLSAEWSGGKPIKLGGIECTLKSLMFEFKQNSLVGSGLACEMTLPFFERPVNLDVSVSGDGSLLASLSAAQPDGVDYDAGLISFEREGVFWAAIEGVSFGLQHGVATLSVSGSLQPTLPLNSGSEWPTFRLRELSIDSEGHVKFDGGWMDLPEHFGLDFHGFQLNITQLGFGQDKDKRGKWVGCSGSIKLVDGFTAGASVKGLRVTWFDDGRKPRVSFDGVGVEFKVPDVLYFKGDVAYRELEVGGQTVRRFDGDIKLILESLGLQIDAKLVVGSASGGSQGSYNFFAIYVGVELPTGIPLGSLPIALYGMAGLFALQMAPNKLPAEAWYDDGWYKRPDVGVTDLDSKWINRRNSMAFGVGVTLGLQPNDFVFSCKALLVLVFPGPTILIDGKAVILAERAKLDDDPLLRSLAVYDPREGQILFGLGAKYKQDEQQGQVIAISADTEAFFATPNKWHLYIGQQPPAKRVRAQILRFLEVNSYFMLDPQRLALGAWAGFARNWGFGPVGVKLAAFIEGGAVINWKPLQLHGELLLHGSVEVNLFGFSLGLSVEARFAADAFEPYHVVASFEFSIKLPKPLAKKSKHVVVTLEWKSPPKWPTYLTLPLKEVAVGHFKVTTTWPLQKGSEPPAGSAPPQLGPRYDWQVEGMRAVDGSPLGGQPPLNVLNVVPLDGRIHLAFGTSVHDDARVGVNPQPVVPAFERIGDPERDEGSARARYGLKQLLLSKWDAHLNDWRVVAVAGRAQAAGERALYGAWAAVPKAPSAAPGQVSNDKLIVSGKSGFDHTRHGGEAAAGWFAENFPGYPCVPQEIPDREVCCDFERLERSQRLTSPWRSSERPEITLTWQPRTQLRVTYLFPPVKDFTRALCVPAAAQVSPAAPSVLSPAPRMGLGLPTSAVPFTINLAAPAKRVRVWFVEKRRDASVCLDFRQRARGDVKLPLNEQGVTINLNVSFPVNASATIEPVQTTLGEMTGLNCYIPTSADPRSVAPVLLVLPCAAAVVELLLTQMPSPAGSKPVTVEAFNAAGERFTKTLLNPLKQPEVVRLEGRGIIRLIIQTAESNKVYLHRLCFTCPDTSPAVMATGFDPEGRATRGFSNVGDLIEVFGQNLTRVQLSSTGEICLLKICALFGPDPKELAERAEMAERLRQGAERWKEEAELFEPFSTYRLQIDTTIDAYGQDKLSGDKHLTQTEFAYFRTEGPPGKAKLSLPAGRRPEEADKFESGLDDLTRYVRQTTPPTVPAAGEKPVMFKPFYRAFDITVYFNENYVDLIYRMSGLGLGLYLYDANGRPARDAEGRLLTESGKWEKGAAPTLTPGERRWLALSKSASCHQPAIDEKDLPPDKKLTSAIAGRVLEPDTIYEARLTPLLLHEGFDGYAAGAAAQGPSGRLGRWQVRDDGDSNTPSVWSVGAAGGHVTQTSHIKRSVSAASDPSKLGTMLLFGNDPSLTSNHQEQPANWTDYRLSVRLSAAAGGALGVVFRYRDGSNYYRFSADRNGQYRRLVRAAGGIHTALAEDVFIYETQRDYLFTVEAVGEALHIYQDGALVFRVSDAAHAQGGVGLYCHDNAGVRFAEVRVDDFRQDAPAVYRFPFTTSRYANFFHHLHSYQDETWRVALEGAPGPGAVFDRALAKAAGPETRPTEDETRAYETLAAAVLGQAARQNPPEVQVTRVEVDGAPVAYLVQSPEPFDWPRTDLAFSRAVCTRTEPALPGDIKLAAVNFGANRTQIASVVTVLREPLNLTGYRIESRLVAWPLSPKSGMVLDPQVLPPEGLAGHHWTTYHTFKAGAKLPAGTVLKALPSSSGPPPSGTLAVPGLLVSIDAGSVEQPRGVFFSAELRIVAPDGKVVHTRHFLPDEDYVAEDVKVLRKADGTGFFIVKTGEDFSGTPFSLAQYRLKLTYHRDNETRVPGSPVWSQAGDRSDEVAVLDIPLQTQ